MSSHINRILLLGIVVVFGVLVPWFKGLAFLDPILIVAYACTGILFAGPVAAEAFGVQAPRVVLRKVAAITGYGWGISALLLCLGIATVNATNWHGRLITPSTRLLISSLILSAAACLAVVGFSAILAAKFGSRVAKTALRLALLILLLMAAFGYRHLPEDWQFTIDQNLTTAGLIRATGWAALGLAILGSGLTAWFATSRAKTS